MQAMLIINGGVSILDQETHLGLSKKKKSMTASVCIHIKQCSLSLNHRTAVNFFHRDAVTAVSWFPHGTYLASVDKAKWATIWGDHV